MERIELITRTERRRTYSEAEKAQVLAEAAAPGATVREVSRRLGIAESLIYNWRSAARRRSAAAQPESDARWLGREGRSDQMASVFDRHDDGQRRAQAAVDLRERVTACPAG